MSPSMKTNDCFALWRNREGMNRALSAQQTSLTQILLYVIQWMVGFLSVKLIQVRHICQYFQNLHIDLIFRKMTQDDWFMCYHQETLQCPLQLLNINMCFYYFPDDDFSSDRVKQSGLQCDIKKLISIPAIISMLSVSPWGKSNYKRNLYTQKDTCCWKRCNCVLNGDIWVYVLSVCVLFVWLYELIWLFINMIM